MIFTEQMHTSGLSDCFATRVNNVKVESGIEFCYRRYRKFHYTEMPHKEDSAQIGKCLITKIQHKSIRNNMNDRGEHATSNLLS